MKSKTGAVHPKTAAVKSERKRLILLGVLLLLIIVVVSAQWNRIVRPQGPPPKSDTSQKANRQQPAAHNPANRQNPKNGSAFDPEGEPVLEYPMPEPLQFAEEKRNIFAFFIPPPPPPPDPVCGNSICEGGESHQNCASDCQPPPPPPPDPVCGNSICESGENHQNCASDCQPPPPPPPPPISLKYIGFLRESNGATAFLTDGKEIFVGRVKDIIANKYRVVKITDDGVELAYLHHATKETKTIPFEGNDKN